MKIFLHIFQMVSSADEFHKYSVIWSEDTIKWFVDEIAVFTLTRIFHLAVFQVKTHGHLMMVIGIL